MFVVFGSGDDGPNPDKGLCIPFNVKIFEILPVLDYVFKHTLCRVEALETCPQLKSSHSDVLDHVIVFLSKLYTQVEDASKPSALSTENNKLMASILVNVNTFFFDLDAPIESSCGYRLGFYKIHDVKNKQWTHEDIQAAITFTYANLNRLDVYLSGLLSRADCERRPQTNMLLNEVGDRTKEFLKCSETPTKQLDKIKSSAYLHGLVLCSVDRYYKKIEKYAKATGEWKSLKQDLIELVKSSNDVVVRLNKLRIIECLDDFYQCTMSEDL